MDSYQMRNIEARHRNTNTSTGTSTSRSESQSEIQHQLLSCRSTWTSNCSSRSSSRSTNHRRNHANSLAKTSSSFPTFTISTISLLILTISLLLHPVASSPFADPFSSSSASHQDHFNKRQVIYNESSAIDGKVDFYSPISNRTKEGQMLTIIPGPYAIGLGEPLNAIVSARSDPEVLTVEGFLLWATSINFGVSCLGQANGTLQLTDLGDGTINRTQGNGNGENGVLRYNFGNAYIGTCRETFEGGNHFRWWIQNGTEANSGAYFLAASAELPLAQNHLIMPDGYNKGRDEMIGNATLPNGTSYGSHYFNTTVQWIEAGILLNATSEGINHAPEVAVDGRPAQDGRVAVLTVKYLSGPRKIQDNLNSAMGISLPTLSIVLAATIAMLPLLLI